ncbi:MAG: tRNA pseudouridine(55) synthase TruB [Chloroflexi bacterium]|nr:tRNA pseudouridine(55) synthase TruB [Chloroflexota bacterium]
MARRKPSSVFGLLNVHKPPGPTSHDVVQTVRRGTRERRIGHAGTLDPMAEGVLVLALGQATRLIEYLMASQKRYRAEVTLGVVTDSYDAEGDVLEQHPLPPGLTHTQIDATLDRFRGEIQQVPPVYSALKIDGKSAHARVRAGETVTLEPRAVTISELALLDYAPPILQLDVRCSPGTYIRSLAHDLGQELGCGAMLSSLVRTESGQFTLDEAISLDTLRAAFEAGSWRDKLLSADMALATSPRVDLTEDEWHRIQNGAPIARISRDEALARGYDPHGRFACVLTGQQDDPSWRPRKVFPPT